MLWVVALPHRILIVSLLGIFVCNGVNDDEFKTVDVAKLANITHGTELALLDNAYKVDKSYKIEDFFWTGSGDGSGDDNNYETSTIYKTKTILSTIYIDKPSTHNNQTVMETTTRCSFNCEGPSIPDGEINPTSTTSTESHQNNVTGDYDENAARQFWLLTVLKGDGRDPVILDLKNNLAKLYKTAFHRQQERHLGIGTRKKRTLNSKEPVNVYIHNIAKSDNGDEKIEVLYHVSVSGKPVDAITAAADMKLVTDEEVIQELGYPFLVKAEPYLKPSEAQELTRANNTWIFIGSSLSILILLLLVVAFLSLCLNKHKRDQMGAENRQQVFGEAGQVNLAFVRDQKTKSKQEFDKKQSSPTYINFKRESLTKNDQGITVSSRPGSSISYTSTSASSLDISPLMGLHNQQRNSLKKPMKTKTIPNKTTPLMIDERRLFVMDSDSSISSNRRDSPDTIYVGRYEPGITSPKSYLSMPSVKSFPSRAHMPEPLNKVLEPVSVLHLDLPEDNLPVDPEFQLKRHRQTLIRHGSMGTEEDPGVVGPVVWNIHCQRLQHGVSVDEGMNDIKLASNMTRMRKRFHDLLDDTFSLFGSRRDSPNEELRPAPIEVKSHSAITSLNKQSDEVQPTVRPRPKTSDPKRIIQVPGNDPPKGAWASKAPSPMVRPLSAGHFQTPRVTPRVDVDLVLAEGKFQVNDPAIPLIAAIKDEIGKCSLPGSTTNLAE